MIDLFLELVNGLILLTAFVFAWESTKMVEEKKTETEREKE